MAVINSKLKKENEVVPGVKRISQQPGYELPVEEKKVSTMGTGSGAAQQSASQQQTVQPASTQQNTVQTSRSSQSQPAAAASGYDAGTNTAYQEAMAALRQAQSSMPSYAGTYDGQLEEIYRQIVGREKFSYDLNADALYQQYANQYAQQGRMAMMDTMGQAAAMTGGYGNSYAQQAGQQSYQAYLQQMNEMVPELYGLARDAYDAEGEALLNQYAMMGDLASQEYSRYQDALSQYWQNVSHLQDQADSAYDRGYNEWLTQYQMGVDQDNTAYQRQQDAYERLSELIATTGYTPSTEDLTAAGMSEGQAAAYADYYEQNVKKSSSGSSGGSSSGGYDNSGYDTDLIKQAQELVGATADGRWGSKSAAAAAKMGYNSLEEVIAALGGALPDAVQSANTDKFISSLMTKEQAASRGITGKEYTAMVEDRINHSNLTDGEVRYLLQYYGFE